MKGKKKEKKGQKMRAGGDKQTPFFRIRTKLTYKDVTKVGHRSIPMTMMWGQLPSRV